MDCGGIAGGCATFCPALPRRRQRLRLHLWAHSLKCWSCMSAERLRAHPCFVSSCNSRGSFLSSSGIPSGQPQILDRPDELLWTCPWATRPQQALQQQTRCLRWRRPALAHATVQSCLRLCADRGANTATPVVPTPRGSDYVVPPVTPSTTVPAAMSAA